VLYSAPPATLAWNYCMNPLLAAFVGGWQVILILAIVLIFFGARKLPELAKGLGQGIKEFKKASREIIEDNKS
jgi:sec-independent protein translocase protein TatA